MKSIYIPISRPFPSGKRSKKRVIQKTQSANSSDEDESFRAKKKSRNRGQTIGISSIGILNPSYMKEQVIEGYELL